MGEGMDYKSLVPQYCPMCEVEITEGWCEVCERSFTGHTKRKKRKKKNGIFVLSRDEVNRLRKR